MNDASILENKNYVRIHLITYGNDLYKKQRVFFRKLAENARFFDKITVFTPRNLDKKFRNKFQSVLQLSKGAGYWIWKPYLLKRMIGQIPHNDILIYCDAGCLINGEGRRRFTYYIERLQHTPTGSLAFELPYKEYEYTKREVFNYFKCEKDIKISNQLVGGVLLFRKCNHSNNLIDTYFNVLQDNVLLFTDEKNRDIQDEKFIDHRHDQSVFSIIRKQLGTDILPDETYFTDFLNDGLKYPIWAARMKG